MSDQQSQHEHGLSEKELEGQEAHDLPHREVMSLLGGASSTMPLPPTSAMPGIDGQGLDPQTYPDAGGAGDVVEAPGGLPTHELPLTNTADTNTVDTTTSASDTATS
ncbi:MAG: hypothetical protein QOH93_605 [Chloroflexia bacterium]|jgi:hypothetical protein|nr:hypothetical protein [Chloroflexia bacterium]